MSTELVPPIPAPVHHKSPGRVAQGKRLHALNLAGMGGRRPSHGRRALTELLKRGWEGGGEQIAEMSRERELAYLSDLGGADNVSEMDKSIIRRLVGLDLDWLLLVAQTDKAAGMPLEKRLMVAKARNQNATTHIQLIRTLGGPGRRPAVTKGEIVIRRFADEESA